MSDSGRTLSDPRDDPWAEVRRLTAALAAAEGVNGLLRIEAGNATAARKQYESAWRQSEVALAVAERERDDARAEVERLNRYNDELQSLHGLQEQEIDRLTKEVAGLRQQLAAAREALNMTATENERRLATDNLRLTAERERYLEIARDYLAAFDRVGAIGKAMATTLAACDDIEEISDESWDVVRKARDEADDRLGDLRASVAGTKEGS